MPVKIRVSDPWYYYTLRCEHLPERPMQQLSDNLYITDAPTVRRLPEDHDFDEVVTLGYSPKPGYDFPTASTTEDSFVFPDGEHDYDDFRAATDYVLTAVNRDDKVLVHCQAGISRSTGVCSVVLTECTDITLAEALNHIEQSRPIANPAPEIRDSMEQYTGQSINPAPIHLTK